ncbi:porin [Piscinibacter defluvii]|uniref:porin n=1 Tax=Piscinibacter defluvii TaxID=1796922 RepID=UPI000FDE82FA|nr:porin [Piscinibacter defluvii]
MQRIIGAALAGLAAAGTAAAQGVTIGGVADAALRHVRNEGLGAVSSLVSGSNSTSRLIVRGSEDLGAGLSAAFHLEHGLLLDSGAPASSTLFWDRRATVSLASKTLGEVRAGRDFVPSYVNWSRYDPFSYVGVAGSTHLISATPNGPIRAAFGSAPNSVVRASNAVQWLAPSGWGGLEAGVMLAAGEGGTAANGQHKVIGARLGYTASAFSVSAASTRTRNDLTGTDRFDDHAVAGAYDFGPVRVSAAWRRFALAEASQTNLMLGAWVPMGQGELKASWQKADFGGRVGSTAIDGNSARKLGLGYVHNLSKRSALYGTLAQISNRGASATAVPGGASGLAAGGSSRGIEFGVRHNF